MPPLEVGPVQPGVDRALELVEHLSEPECLRLVSTVAIGRVALTRHALPVVLPVNFALEGHGVIIRTGTGSILAGAQDEMVVAFEVDDYDSKARTGWSVLVIGTMTEIVSPSALIRAQQLGIDTWPGGERDHYVRISPGLISGRRVGLSSGRSYSS